MAVRGVRPYQRRRRGPIIAVVAALAVLAAATWTTVLFVFSGAGGAVSCPSPADGSSIGEVLPRTALDAVAPVSPTAVSLRVFNAGGQRGQANLVSAQLREFGFTESAPPDNDPRFPDDDMECVGQLRYGPAGEAAASTVALVLPCVELVRDGRADAGVDIAIGTAFGDVDPVRAARDALTQLATPASGSDGAANADPNSSASAVPPAPTVDQATLQKARDAICPVA